MEYAVSRVIVQRLCDERPDLVPYLSRIVDSLERHKGLYRAQLADVVPADVVDELDAWLAGYVGISSGVNAGLDLLERIFEPAKERGGSHA